MVPLGKIVFLCFSSNLMKVLAPPHRISLPLGFSLDMQAIKGGEIWLEDKNHEVSDFFLGTYPVTNEQYAFFLNAYGSDIIKDGQYQGQKMINPHRWGIQEAEAAWGTCLWL